PTVIPYSETNRLGHELIAVSAMKVIGASLGSFGGHAIGFPSESSTSARKLRCSLDALSDSPSYQVIQVSPPATASCGRDRYSVLGNPSTTWVASKPATATPCWSAASGRASTTAWGKHSSSAPS